MKIKYLRFFCQLAFFSLITLIFIGFLKNRSLIEFIHSLHIFPSISKIMWWNFTTYLFITFSFLFITLVFGRIYCSYLCPVGLIQDLSNYFNKKFFKKIHKKKNSISWLRYSFFFLSLTFLLLKTSYYMLFDHYSSFGRLFSLSDLEISFSFFLSIIFLISILLIPFFYPRFFCSNICPSGFIFKILQKRSFLKIKTSKTCNFCNICQNICPTYSIENGKIDFETCIACYECIFSCQKNCLSLRNDLSIKFKNIFSFNYERRNFFSNIATSCTSIFAATLFVKFINKNIPLKNVIPPGSTGKTNFFSRCISCEICKNICPTKVIEINSFGNGLLGLSKPKMNYDKSYCSFECNACMSVCPSNALTFHPILLKKKIKIGNALLNKNLCIPYVKGMDCGACAEHCPTGAITMIQDENVNLPIVNKEYCIGCGACQWSCPTIPEKSIIIEPLETHSIAYNPKQFQDEYEIKVSTQDEFPF